jgi:hypothetical protein
MFAHRYSVLTSLDSEADSFRTPVLKGNTMSHDSAFYAEECKSLRQEISTKLKDRLEPNRWGLIGVAALYGYIFSNPISRARRSPSQRPQSFGIDQIVERMERNFEAAARMQ